MNYYYFPSALAVLLAGVVAAPALAQSDQQSRDRQDRQNQRQNQQDRERQKDSRRQQDSRQQQDAEYRLQPRGWVAVGYDHDNDGYYESADYLYYYDLQQAKQRSQQRKQDSQQARQGRQGKRGQQMRVSGKVTNMGLKGLTIGKTRQSDREFRFAKIEKDSGETCRVMLGSEDKVAQLDIQAGDQITVEGVRGKIDGRDVLLAKRVSTENDSITNKLPPRQQWRQISGEIRRMRRTDQGRDTRHAVVQLRNSDKQIDLGPVNELQDLDLQQGDRISILARKGRVGGERMLVAQKIRANGQTIDVREATHRSISRGDSGQQQRR